MAILLGCLGLIVLVGLAALWRGFVITYLWQWFVVPFGLPEIGLFHAAGISLLVAFLTYEMNGKAAENVEDGISKVITTLLLPAVALLFGWIWHSFM